MHLPYQCKAPSGPEGRWRRCPHRDSLLSGMTRTPADQTATAPWLGTTTDDAKLVYPNIFTTIIQRIVLMAGEGNCFRQYEVHSFIFLKLEWVGGLDQISGFKPSKGVIFLDIVKVTVNFVQWKTFNICSFFLICQLVNHKLHFKRFNLWLVYDLRFKWKKRI